MTTAEQQVAPDVTAAGTGYLRVLAVVGGVVALTVVLALYNLTQGEPDSPISAVIESLFRTVPVEGDIQSLLIRDVRLPRVLMALMAGSALGLAGVLLQDSLRNPLADPTLLGVAQGAGFIVALSVLYPEVVPSMPLPVLTLIGGTLAGGIVLYISRNAKNPVRVVLAGAMLSVLFATLSTVVIQIAPRNRGIGIIAYFRFVIGNFTEVRWEDLRMVLPWFVIAVPVTLLTARVVNLLQLGDEAASGLGLDPGRARLGLMLLAMFLVTPYVAAIGPIGFVALFAPHVARSLLASTDARRVMVAAGLIGALVLLIADSAGRLLFFPTEMPAGVFTWIIVGPLALVLVGRLGKRGGS
ncbi:MAG: iron ABC transporter permease [Actinomycetota bacterium]